MTLPLGWIVLGEARCGPEAALLGDLLERNGIPVYLRHLRDLPGLEAGTLVAVPEEWLARAQSLLGEVSFTEAELAALALDPGGEPEK
jgi:hypothetical protein